MDVFHKNILVNQKKDANLQRVHNNKRWIMERIFRRKLYERLLEWKRVSNGKTAIMVEGARRVGKSTLVELCSVK